MDSSLLSGEKKVAQANLAIDAHRRKGTSKNAGIEQMTVRQ
jgi:HPt (histidine-containing phosphotransfer) domain-containing protein